MAIAVLPLKGQLKAITVFHTRQWIHVLRRHAAVAFVLLMITTKYTISSKVVGMYIKDTETHDTNM